jgi:hypothetical protein
MFLHNHHNKSASSGVTHNLRSYKSQSTAFIKSLVKYHKGRVIQQSWGICSCWLGQIVSWGNNTSCTLVDSAISHQIKPYA